jgi:hypothetical protein
MVLNQKIYKIGDKVYFLEPLIHPVSKELITYGMIINFKKDGIHLYLADGCDCGENCYSESWIDIFPKEKLEKLIKS